MRAEHARPVWATLAALFAGSLAGVLDLLLFRILFFDHPAATIAVAWLADAGLAAWAIRRAYFAPKRS